MCKMKKSKTGTYVRDGMSVEVVAKTTDSHTEMLAHGVTALNLDIQPPPESCVGLFTMSGSLIPSAKEWTLGEYLRRIKKNEAKMGIAYLEVLQDNYQLSCTQFLSCSLQTSDHSAG